jgi:hypothetical protein
LLFAAVASAFNFDDDLRNLLAYRPSGTLTPSAVHSSDADHCSSIMPQEHSKALIDSLDRNESSFASTTQDEMGRTTEGGEQTTYTHDGVRQIVEQRFYGETGRAIARLRAACRLCNRT